MSKTTKAALAGAGALGTGHLDGIKNIDGVEVISLVSAGIDETRAVADWRTHPRRRTRGTQRRIFDLHNIRIYH